MLQRRTAVIPPEVAGNLAGLFHERAQRDPEAIAYRQFDEAAQAWTDRTWSEAAGAVARWRGAFDREGLARGERVALMARNRYEWVLYDQAALGLGLVVVPLYVNDRTDNLAYILEQTEARILLIDNGEQWRQLAPAVRKLESLRRIVSLSPIEAPGDERVMALAHWLEGARPPAPGLPPGMDDLATVVYTSGTTGRPKGVMLTHGNLLWNAHASLQRVPATATDTMLSFLPLSHTLERTVGYYAAVMCGATVAYARSVADLPADLRAIRPTVLISVPRIFERFYNRIRTQLQQGHAFRRRLFEATVEAGWHQFLHHQGRAAWRPHELLVPVLHRLVAEKVRAHLGGRVRLAVCGGARLAPEVARTFLALGVPIVHGYGTTEAAPVISTNSLDDNDPESVGTPLPGLEARLGDDDELLVRSPGVMPGYWRDPDATAAVIDPDGWLHTGDKARIEHGRIYITGRLKEVIVLSTGEKVPPTDMEIAIGMDPLFDQVLIVGEDRPYLSALCVVNEAEWRALAQRHGVDPDDAQVLTSPAVLDTARQRIAAQLHDFPGYAQVYRVALLREPWTIENGMMTPTLKLKREAILAAYAETVETLYQGH